MKFKYSDSKNFILNSNSHERIIIDAMDGNQTLFTSMNEQVYTWKYIDSIISNWQQIPLGIYKKGSRDII